MSDPHHALSGTAGSHPMVDTAITAAAVGGPLTAPLWLPVVNEWMQFALLSAGLIAVIWRWARHFSGRRRIADDSDIGDIGA